ncbi:MAG: phosphorylase [Bacteriovoracaceae bacterium]|nr:phosphorylase [Bacteriovoracaceae bacterium]
MQYFKQGSLWQTIIKQVAFAKSTGALLPIQANCHFLGKEQFIVQVATNLQRKAWAKKLQEEVEAKAGVAFVNPFLPYDKDLFVADVSPSHLILLNKFNLLDNHILIVTRSFVEQSSPLTISDFEALWKCMLEYDALGFYNSGATSGASQKHRHLQMVPLPLMPGLTKLPIEPISNLPFDHYLFKFDSGIMDSCEHAAKLTFAEYNAAINKLGLTGGGPYNLLVTRHWMLIIPRSSESFGSMSLNALGFVGSFFVSKESDLEALEGLDPMEILQNVATKKK